MYDKLFASLSLPVKPAMAATGATVTMIEEVSDEETAESFFGGYADNSLLDDMGVEAAVVDTADESASAKN